MKKYICLTLICILLLPLTHCGQNDGGDGDGRIHIYTWDEPKDDPEGKITRVLQEEFDRTHPDIVVHRSAVPMHKDTRISFVSAMVGGRGPDCYNQAYFSFIYLLIKLNMCLPMNKFLEEDDLMNSMKENIIKAATVDSKIYGIPDQVYVMMLVYRKDLFVEAGLDPDRPPRNWVELGQYAKILTNEKKYRYGYALLGMDWADWHWENFVWQAEGRVTELLDDGRCAIRFNEQPGVEALQFYKDLRWKYKAIQKDPLQSWECNLRDFVNGTAAMFMLHPGDITFLFEMGMDPKTLGLAPLPAGPRGKRAAQIGGGFWIINPTIPEDRQRACWTYIRFMTSPESIRKRWHLRKKAGLIYPDTPYWKGLDQSSLDFISDEWIDYVNESIENGRMEYFLKDRISPYLARAIQSVLVDSLADPKAELDECAKRVNKEVIIPYNEEQR